MKKTESKVIPQKNQIIFYLDTNIYCLGSIYAAAYVFLDRSYVYLDGDPDCEIKVSLKGKIPLNKKELISLEGEFHNELLSSLLRNEVAKNNQKIREYVVATALVSALPSDVLRSVENSLEPEQGSWSDDPLEIAVPWEEKQAKKKNKRKK